MLTTRLCALIAVGLGSGVEASIVDGHILRQSGNGEFVKLDPATAFSVGQDNFDTDHLYGFDESQNIEIVDPIHVDIGGVSGVIAAGTVIASHYVFFDSLDGIHMGTVTFDAPILGIAAFEDTLFATDYLADTQVDYISTELRGLERGDQVWIDERDPNRLWVYWAGSSPGDYIRVFTLQSPNMPIM